MSMQPNSPATPEGQLPTPANIDRQPNKPEDLSMPRPAEHLGVPTEAPPEQQPAPAVNPQQPAAVAAPPPIAAPAPPPPAPPTPQFGLSVDPATLPAEDADLIEKEWVDTVDTAIDHTKDDPYTEEEAQQALSRTYLKKRFQIDID